MVTPKKTEISLPKTHREYQDFVKEQLKIHALIILAFFMDVYVKVSSGSNKKALKQTVPMIQD